MAENEKKNRSADKFGFFKRVWAKIAKFFKDTKSEMKKVVWTSRKETFNNTKLVVVTVIAVGLAIALVDVACSRLVNALAGLIG